MIIDNAASNIVFESSIDTIKITIYGRKKWGWFLPSLFLFLVNGVCFLPIIVLGLIGVAQKYLPEIFKAVVLIIFLLIIFLGLYLYILSMKFLEVIEYIFDKETIIISEQSIKIERSGFWGFRTKKVYLAEKIKGMTTSFSISEQFNLLTRLPFISSNIGAFMFWNGSGTRKFYNFGRGVSQSDAQNLIDTVYRKFPNYRTTSSF